MKIGLIGWYGHQNFGDERILFCIKNFFSDHNFFVTGGWNDARYKIAELNKCDYILIGGGGLLLKNVGDYIDLIHNLKKPFGFLGVSIEAKHKSMEDFFQIMNDKSDFILVRDLNSKKYLNNNQKVIVGPDLTFLYPFDVVNEIKRDICGFNLRDWYYWKGTLHGHYYNIMKKLDKTYPSLQKIYPAFQKWDPYKVTMIVKRNFKDISPLPFYFESTFTNDFDILSKYFKNVPTFFNIEFYNKIRYLIGMRYHSIVFATQCGIPFISLSYQPKNFNYCSDMHLDQLSINIYKLNDLQKKINYLRDHYGQIRDHLILSRGRYIKEINHIFQSISQFMR